MSAPPSQLNLRTVMTACLGVLLVAGLVYAASRTQLAITISLLAAMVAVAMHHAVALLMRWGLKRWLAILTVALVLVGAGVVLAIVLVQPAVNQAQVLAEDVPRLVDKIRKTNVYAVLDKRIHFSTALDRLAPEAPAYVFAAVNALLGLIAAAVSTFIVAIFMLVFGGPLIEAAMRELEPRRRHRIRRMLDNIYRSIGGYVGGATLICWVNTLFTAAFLAILRMPFFLPLAIFSGMSSLIPYVGSISTSIIISVLALASLGTWPAIACAIFFVTYGQLEGNIFGPLLFRRTVHVNPLLTTLGVLFLGEMAGIIGAIVAVPLIAVVQVIVREVLRARRHPVDADEHAAGPLEGAG